MTAWNADSTKAKRFAETHGAKVVSTIEEALQQAPDLAVVMDKPFEMADFAKYLIAIKMPMLIEKPVGAPPTAASECRGRIQLASMSKGIFEWRVSAHYASLCDHGDKLEIITLDGCCTREVEATPVARRYDAMMAKTIDRLRDGGKPAIMLANHWRAMDIIDRCYASAGRGN